MSSQKVTVYLGPELDRAFTRIRGSRIRLYDRKTKRLLAEHNLSQTVSAGDTITLSSFTLSAG